MTTTPIVHICNDSKAPIMVFNIENRDVNISIAAGKHADVTMNVPWCTTPNELLRKGLVITTIEGLIGYLWQHDDKLYFSKSTWQDRDPGYRLPDYSDIGARLKLTVRADGFLSGAKDG